MNTSIHELYMAEGGDDDYKENTAARGLKGIILCLLFFTIFYPQKAWLGDRGRHLPAKGIL